MDKERKFSKRKHPRLDNFDYSSNGAYFITICTHNRRCVLSRIVGRGLAPAEINNIEYTSFGLIAQNQLLLLEKRYSCLSVDKYVIMPDHIHLLITILPAENGRPMGAPMISNMVNQLKGYVTKRIGFPIWQKLYYDHIIRDEEDFNTKWEYIDNNPISWFDKNKIDCEV